MLNQDQIKLLQGIHSKVHGNFTYVSDASQYKLEDKWVAPADEYDGSTHITGDCEDFALACHLLIRKAGMNPRIIVCKDSNKIMHCVCECDGYILCNQQSDVMRRDDLDYIWIDISSYFNPSGSPGNWYSITG